MDLVEIEWGGVDWMVWLRIGTGAIKCWEAIEWLYNWWSLE
jgi:hypothetical protein